MIFDPVYMVIAFGAMAASWFDGAMLKRRFAQYSQLPINLTGREVAEKMLRENGINDVKVISVEGQLTDHYNPQTKTVNLSEVVYHEANVAAAAVAAHECGHAVQHAQAYSFLAMRSSMVPLLSISNNFTPWILMAGLLLLSTGFGKLLLLIGIILFGATTLFTFITLPVEFDASRRALAWLKQGTVSGMTQEKNDAAFNALKWAAMTYVVAALASLATLLYYIMIFLGRRD